MHGCPLETRDGARARPPVPSSRQGGADAVGIDVYRRRALPARGRSGGLCDLRTAPPCPRWKGNSAGRCSRSVPNTSATHRDCHGSPHGSLASLPVMWQSRWGTAIRSVIKENGTGGSSPGWTSSPLQSMVRPSSRGGRAGLETAEPEIRPPTDVLPTGRRPSGSPIAARRPFLSSPDMDHAARKKVPVVMHDRRHRRLWFRRPR